MDLHIWECPGIFIFNFVDFLSINCDNEINLLKKSFSFIILGYACFNKYPILGNFPYLSIDWFLFNNDLVPFI